MQRLGVLTLMLLSTQIASATVIVPRWQCGMQSETSLLPTAPSALDTMPPNALRVVWDDREFPHLDLLPDEDPDDAVAVLVTALGPRARYTYLKKISATGTYVLEVTNPECLARAGISTDEPVCFELVAIDRAGNRSPPTFTCHDIRLPERANSPRAIVNGLEIHRAHRPKPPPPDPEWPWRRFAGIVFALAIASLVWWRWSATRSDH